MKLITQEQQTQMLKNGMQTQQDHIGNHWPVVKLFMPDGAATWGKPNKHTTRGN